MIIVILQTTAVGEADSLSPFIKYDVKIENRNLNVNSDFIQL